jgi:hypothetical protein
MTASFDSAPEPDDRPATLEPAPAPVPYRPRPSAWARVFRWWLGLSAATFLAIALCVFIGFAQTDFAPLHVVIHGDRITDGLTVSGVSDGMGALFATGAALLAFFLLLMIPVLIVLVVGAVAIALVCGIGVPLVLVALVLVLATSPFWLVGLIVWMLVRRRDSQRLGGSARMAA